MRTAGLEAVRTACAVLFVPGHRPDRFSKALGAGADAVVIDLEDAVAPAQKERALEHVVQLLTSTADLSSPVLVRLNPLASPWSDAEQARLAEVVAARPTRLAGVVVPKAEDGHDLTELSRRLTSPGGEPPAVVALVESARGVLRAGGLAGCPGLTRLALGAVDLAVNLNAHADADVLSAARSALVLASAAAGLPAPLDSPSTSVHDLAQVHGEAQRAVREGFGGKLCIHPAQLPVVREAFTPSAAEVEQARRVIAAGAGAAGGAVTVLDGHMVDRPVLLRALDVLRRFEETGA